MLRRVDLRGRTLSKDQYQRELPRANLDVAAAMVAIEPILHRVKSGNESDLISLGEQFDGIRHHPFEFRKLLLTRHLHT